MFGAKIHIIPIYSCFANIFLSSFPIPSPCAPHCPSKEHGHKSWHQKDVAVFSKIPHNFQSILDGKTPLLSESHNFFRKICMESHNFFSEICMESHYFGNMLFVVSVITTPFVNWSYRDVMPVFLYVVVFVVGEQKQVLTFGLPACQKQSVNLAFPGFVGCDVV